MKYFCLLLLVASPALGADNPPLVQSISIIGAQNYQLSQDLLQAIQRLTGAKLSQPALDDLARRVGNELGESSVSPKVAPGDQPATVKVLLEVSPSGDAQAEAKPELNINSRYTVEDVQLKGVDKHRLSRDIRRDLQKLIGQKLDSELVDQLARRIRKDLHARSVSQKVVRGDQPERLKVIFEVSSEDETDFHLSKFVYHGKQAWSAKAFGDFNIAPQTSLLTGLVSDQDELLERYTGIAAGFENRKVGSDRVRLRFLFESYHNQWNGATLKALESNPDVPGVYRNRKSFQPTLTFVLAAPLRLTVGTIFHFFQTQFPTVRTEAANAATASLRYHRRFDDSQGNRHELEAGYDLRAATRTFDSDFSYTRHDLDFGYKIGGPRQGIVARFTAGRLNGRAPLFERYVLGDSTTLRGWNKFDIAPLGGDRVVHSTVEYRHVISEEAPTGEGPASLVAFYDAGSVWNDGQRAEIRHSVGVGARWQHFFAGLAFPVRSGRMTPTFMVGAYFTEGSTF
jgi:outer membrane protein assembly factor BamA